MFFPIMNVDTACRGKKVVYTGQNGQDHDHELAKSMGLEAGTVYELQDIAVHDCSSDVYLKSTEGMKFPSGRQVYFNSVLFADYEDYQAYMPQ